MRRFGERSAWGAGRAAIPRSPWLSLVGLGCALVAGVTAARAAGAEPPRPAVTVRLVGPDRQGAQVLDWFRGARAPHPAAALAAWRRATGRHLSKAREAAIAAFNPEMVRELRVLDGA